MNAIIACGNPKEIAALAVAMQERPINPNVEIYNVRQINTDSVKASFRERDKLGILGCIFREMWEVTDPPYGTAPLTPQEQFAKLDNLWQEAAGIMSAETYTDKKEPNIEFTHTRGKENEKRAKNNC